MGGRCRSVLRNLTISTRLCTSAQNSYTTTTYRDEVSALLLPLTSCSREYHRTQNMPRQQCLIGSWRVDCPLEG